MRQHLRGGVAAAIVGLLLVMYAAVPAVGGDELSTPEQLLTYLADHREDVALVSYTPAPDSTPNGTSPVLMVNADQPMPLASTIKIVVLAGYAREVTAGRMDPDQLVTLADWERFYLPGTDGGAHFGALEELGIAADDLGFALDPDMTVPLDRVVRAMSVQSDNAATDLLLERLGDEVLQAVIVESGLTGQDPPLPILGIFLAWFNHQDGPLTADRVEALLRLTPEQYEARVRELAALYQNKTWRADQLAWLAQQPLPPYELVSTVSNRLSPHGTARDYARIMAGVVTGTFGSWEISARMRRHLEWPLEFPEVQEDFLAYGTKGGSLPGVLTEATFIIPRDGDFGGEPRIVVLFQRNLPQGVYERLSENFLTQVVQRLLATDRSFAQHAKHGLGA